MYTLIVGNKMYSSWSLRGWLVTKLSGAPFRESPVSLNNLAPDPATRGFSPTGLVPCLVDGDVVVWDSLAIAEYLAERHPGMWPADPVARAFARSMSAEMHSGFGALRSHFPMNIEASLPAIGTEVLKSQAGVRVDLERVVALWSELLETHGGPMLFGEFSIADAYFAPVCSRVKTYGLPVPVPLSAYVERVFAAPGVAAWVRDALAEHDFLQFEEDYRTQGS